MKKILIVKLSSLGDLIASSPHAIGIKSANPDYDVHLLTMEHMKPCAVLLDGYSQIHFIPSRLSAKGLVSIFKVFLSVFLARYDAVYNFHRNIFIALFLRFCNLCTVYSYNSGIKRQFIEKGVVEFSPLKNRTLQEYELIKNSGILIKKPSRLFLKTSKKIVYDHALRDDYICLSMGGGNIHSDARSRIWPVSSYISLIKKLPEKIVLVGAGEADQILADIVLKSVDDCDRVKSFVNHCNLTQTTSIISEAKLFIGNDSGLSYVASAVGTKTLVLFGPTPVGSALPLGRNVHHLFEKIPCAPCYDPRDGLKGKMYKCTSNMCMQNLSVETVLAKTSDLLTCHENTYL